MVRCPYCAENMAGNFKISKHRILAACAKCKNPVVMAYGGVTWTVEPTPNAGDIREIAQEGSIGAAILDILGPSIARLPILPEIAQRILTLIQDSDANMRSLAELIRQDSVIAMKILQLANSAMYGGLTQIKDLDAACARLGMQQINNAVQSIANGFLYVTKDAALKERMQRLWRHAIASAYCAFYIAQTLAEPRADMLFVAGLTHDIGKVLLLNMIANPTNSPSGSPVLSSLHSSPELFEEVMENFHSLCGLHVLQVWELPPEFGITAYCSQFIDRAPDEHWRGMVHIVALAGTIAEISGFGVRETTEQSLLGNASVKYLGLSDMKLAELRVDLEDRIVPLLEISTVG